MEIVVTIRTNSLDKLALNALAQSVGRTAKYMTTQAGVEERDFILTAEVKET